MFFLDLLNVYENLVVFYDAGLVLRFKKAGQVYDYSNQVHAILKIGINIKIVVILSKQKIPKSCDLGSIISVAGSAGFEPANAGTKTQCLTAWRRSNLLYFSTKIDFSQ